MRELVQQHGLQQGNDARMAVIEKALKEKFSLLPDDGTTADEKLIYHEAEKLVETLKR